MARTLSEWCGVVAALCLACGGTTWAQWHPAGGNLRTDWAATVDPAAPWPEYPRPVLERPEWRNLNGLWDYAVRPRAAAEPEGADGKILVPFCIESSLSGVGRHPRADEAVWYRTTFAVPPAWRGRRVVLHFGAVDWRAEASVNGHPVGSHDGGYAPFWFDVTDALLAGEGPQRLTVKAWDPTDASFHPVGKQRNDPSLIWYTAVSGIWQTVWLEPVAAAHVERVVTTADVDRGTLAVAVRASAPGATVTATLRDGDRVVATATGPAAGDVTLTVPSPKLWSPDHPFLYGLDLVLSADGKAVDRVRSYAAMRQVSTHRDPAGHVRLQLNGHDLFMFGPLDQGYWPDGLYTPPSDAAMRFDLEKTKRWGFNLVRKHMKVEPARWYTACDRLGLLVWQDMPAGDGYSKWEPFKLNGGEDRPRTDASKADYRAEWRDVVDALMPYPCISTWTPFNEDWGQFDTIAIADWTKAHDPSRLVDPASGGNHRPCGDMLDVHHYPDPALPAHDPDRANVLGEYGGLLLTVPDHLWKTDASKSWDKHAYTAGDQVTREYVRYAHQLGDLVPQGLSAAVYTQTTDVEVEVNGLMTYDRKVVKVDEDAIARANADVIARLGGGAAERPPAGGDGIVRGGGPADFIRGVDLSLLDRTQDRGVQYRDGGRVRDPLLTLADHGCNLVRLRLFVAPDGTDGQVNTLPYTLRLARRVKAAGFALLLDLHYSDGWADPSKQVLPAQWRGLSHPQLVDRVHSYTRDTLAAFRRAGAVPDLVEVGNEVTNGMLWPDGGPLTAAGHWNDDLNPAAPAADAPWDRFTDLLKAGIRGVHDEDAGGRTRIMVHVDKGGSPSVGRWFFDNVTRRGVRFDVIGLSYYPFWHGTLDDLSANLASLSAAYGKDVIVAETGYDTWGGPQGKLPFPITPAGQQAFLTQLIRTVHATPGGHGRGVVYWAPEWIDGNRWGGPTWSGQWEQRALFDPAGNPRPALDAFRVATPRP